MTTRNLDDVFFYIVNRPIYFHQAVVSAMRVKELMPNNPIFMFITEPLDWKRNDLPTTYFDGRIKLMPDDEYVQQDRWFLQSNHLMAKAVECLNSFLVRRAVYLDCDTYMVDPVPELFEMTDHFDLIGAHAPGRITAPTTYDIPSAFPEMNIGVNPMAVSLQMVSFWYTVAAQHLEYIGNFGNNDQAPLRQVLYSSYDRFPRFYILPPEYNLRFHFPFMVKGRVKILHGPQEHAEKVAEIVNRNQGDMRAWNKILENL